MNSSTNEKKMNSIGSRIRLCRYNSGQTQTEFARTLGITQSTLSKYENDSMVVPPDVLASLVELGWSSDWLLLGREEPGIPLAMPGISPKSSGLTGLERKRYETIERIKKLNEKQLSALSTLLDQFLK